MPIHKSIVLVTVDCLRADHVGFNGYARNVSPFLDSLAQSSITFSDAIVTGAPTYFSFPGIMASRPPLGLGRDILGIAPGETTLASVLRDAGFRTAAFLAGNPYLSRRFGYDHGFDTFEDFLGAAVVAEKSERPASAQKTASQFNRWLRKAAQGRSLTAAVYEDLYFRYCQWVSAHESDSMDSLRRYPAADVIVDHAGAWLNQIGDEPFFLWLHLMDPHHPYYPPAEALQSMRVPITARRARYLNACWNREISAPRLRRYRDEIISLYDAGVFWVDRQISRLVRVLQGLRRWDNTVLAVTGDHGESFLENGVRYHSPTNLSEPLIRVPLLVRSAELAAARITETPFSLIHLAPTLLQGVGIAVPDAFHGRGHWHDMASGILSGEPGIVDCIDTCNNPLRREDRIGPRLLAVRDREFKLVIRFRDKTEYFYDLKTDREEQSPIPVAARPQEPARLLRIARSHLEASRKMQSSPLALRARVREIKLKLAELRPDASV